MIDDRWKMIGENEMIDDDGDDDDDDDYDDDGDERWEMRDESW